MVRGIFFVMKYLIVGLGNIGPEYHETRHNIGFMVLDELANQKSITFESNKLGSTTQFRFKGRTIILLKPNTYMNLSGKSVRYWSQQHKIPTENILVITDDLALPCAKIRLKAKGVPHYKKEGAGDIIIELSASLPENLSNEQKELLQKLKNV